jgi:hypothetical protein
MSNHALLNNIDHKELKINTEKSEQYGNNTMHSIVFPFEFKHVQADYPIFFHKNNATNEFTTLALFGFKEQENLFLKNGEWTASYIPLMVEREPFLIGYQTQTENGEAVENTVIHIDLDSPRVNTEKGTDIFLPHGGNSEYINKISSMLKAIDDSKVSTKLFMDTMTEYDLFEPFNLDIQLKDGSNNRLSGFYTINEDKLSQLDGAALEHLNRSGLLMLIYMVIASHENINALIQRKDG